MNRSTSTRSPRSSTERAGAAALLAAILLFLLAPAGTASAGGASAADVRAKAREALSDPRYQRAFPQHEPEDGAGKPRRSRRELPAEREGGPGPSISLPRIGLSAFVVRVVFVTLLVVIVLLVGGWIVRAVLDRRREELPQASAGTGERGEAAPGLVPSFDEASRLAAEGRHAEAVHALLLAAIRHFAERSRIAIQPSRTSRELVRTLPLGPEAREAFSDLVGTVERSLFGGSAVAAEDYERSLARFQALTRRAAA